MQSSQPSCLCGRVFTTQSALTNHQHTCVKSKKRLSSTLDKAKLLLGSKRRRIEQEPSVSELPSDTPAIQPIPNQVIVYSSTAIIKSILLIPLFAFRYLLIQQMKTNPWQQDDSVDRIVGFLNDSEISFLRRNRACHQPTYLFNYLQLMKHHKPLLDNHFPAEFSAHLVIFLALYVNTSQTNFHLSILRRKLPSLNYPTTQLHLPWMIPIPPPTSTRSQMKAPFVWATGTGQEGLASHYKALKIWLILLGILILIPEIFVK